MLTSNTKTSLKKKIYDTRMRRTPAGLKANRMRKAARRKLEKLGRVRKFDKKDVNHKSMNTNDNSLSNLEVISRSKNRSMNRKPKRKKRASKGLRRMKIKK